MYSGTELIHFVCKEMQIYTIRLANLTAKPQFCLLSLILPGCLLLTSSLTSHFESIRSKSIYNFFIQLEFMNKMPFNRPNVISGNEWTFGGNSKPKKFDTISPQWKFSFIERKLAIAYGSFQEIPFCEWFFWGFYPEWLFFLMGTLTLLVNGSGI